LAIRTTDVRDIPSIQAARESLKTALNMLDIAGAASTLDALLSIRQDFREMMAAYDRA
jgi:hypothetical protein